MSGIHEVSTIQEIVVKLQGALQGVLELHVVQVVFSANNTWNNTALNDTWEVPECSVLKPGSYANTWTPSGP